MNSNSYNVQSTSSLPYDKLIETLRQRGHFKFTKEDAVKSGIIDLRDLYITPEIMKCISLYKDDLAVNSLEVRFFNCTLGNTTMNFYTRLDLKLVFRSSYVKN